MTDTERKGRKVRFHGRVQFKTIRHVADFSEDEIIAGWYRKKDFMRMSEEVSEIAQLVAQGKESHNGEELSIRGLEHLVEEDVADYRAEKMIASIDAVLDEQDDQRDEDVDDPAVIAQIYSEIVAPLQREAYLVGLRDAKDGEEAAAQIPDLKPEEVVPSDSLSKSKKMESLHTAVSEEGEAGEEMLHLDQEKEDAKTKEKSQEASETKLTAQEKKEARKQKRALGPKASEISPLVRRRDGTFAFRNNAAEEAKKVESKQRKDSVRAALFKFLDDDEDEELPIDAFLKKGKGR